MSDGEGSDYSSDGSSADDGYDYADDGSYEGDTVDGD